MLVIFLTPPSARSPVYPVDENYAGEELLSKFWIFFHPIYELFGPGRSSPLGENNHGLFVFSQNVKDNIIEKGVQLEQGLRTEVQRGAGKVI